MKNIFLGCLLAVCTFTQQAESTQDCCESFTNSFCCQEGNFNGFYVGGNLGALTHIARRNDIDGYLVDNSGWCTMDTTFTAGLQGGYDWQCGSAVLGVVADWNFANCSEKLKSNPNATEDDDFVRSQLEWTSTIRARAGLTVCNALMYVTAGGAFAKVKTKWTDESDPPVFNHNKTRFGWTGGVGSEFQVCRNLNVGTEVLFMHFADKSKTFETDEETPIKYSFVHNDSAWTGRVYLTYRL